MSRTVGNLGREDCHVRNRTIGAVATRSRRLSCRQQAHSVALIGSKKIAARKAGPRTLVDVASVKAYYQSLPLKTDHAPLVFGERAHIRPRPHRKH
jgi:hypothetical protein